MDKESKNDFTARDAAYNLLSEIGLEMSSFSDIGQLSAFFVNKMAEMFQAARVSLMLLDQTSKELFIKASYGLSHDTSKVRVKLGQMFAGWVAEQGRSLLVKNVESEFPDLLKIRAPRYQSKSFVIIPIKLNPARNNVSSSIKGEIIGILSLTERQNSAIFSEEELKIINLLCQIFGLHIENINLGEKNSELITTDLLTGLFNHRYFHEHLLEEMCRSERYRNPLSLLMLDIDDFLHYNQIYGYSSGDAALKQVADIIKKNIRRVDSAVRYGPEEFMVILPNTRLKYALKIAARIKAAVNFAVFTKDRTTSLGMAKLTVSLGVSEYKIGMGKEELMRRTLSALLQAKLKGKNRVCVFK